MVVFLYSIFAYIVGLIGQIWFILYLGDWEFITNIHRHQNSLTIYAILVDTLLVLVFALQHSVMARNWFKSKINKIIPSASERATYVLLSGIVLILIVLYWQPIDGNIWAVQDTFLWWVLTGLMIFGWLFSVVATFVINHFELFGLQQGYYHLKNRKTPDISFQENFLYKFIRHPIQFGVLIGIWFTPIMTFGHLLLSFLFTVYIFVGLYYEEKDLVKELGEAYIDYKNRIGMIIPKIKF